MNVPGTFVARGGSMQATVLSIDGTPASRSAVLGCDGRTGRDDVDGEAATTAFVRAASAAGGAGEKRLSVRHQVVETFPHAVPLPRIVALEDERCSGFAGRAR